MPRHGLRLGFHKLTLKEVLMNNSDILDNNLYYQLVLENSKCPGLNSENGQILLRAATVELLVNSFLHRNGDGKNLRYYIDQYDEAERVLKAAIAGDTNQN